MKKRTVLPFVVFSFFATILFAQPKERMPRFPGCEDVEEKQERINCASVKMLEYIYSNLSVPTAARENNTQGTVVIRFVISKDGYIEEPSILRDIGDGCGEEALRVVELMPRWIPGYQKGEPVDVYYNLPVIFGRPTKDEDR